MPNQFKSKFPVIFIIWASIFAIFNALSVIGSIVGFEQNLNTRVFEKQVLTEITKTSLVIYMIVNIVTVILGIWLVIKFIKIKNKIEKSEEVKYSKVEKYLTTCYYILPFLEFIFYFFYTQYDGLKFSTFLIYLFFASPSLIIFVKHLDYLKRLETYNKNLELKK